MIEHVVQRSYKVRFYPTAKQRQMLQQCFGAARWVWNDCLAMRIKAYRRRVEHITGTDYSRHLTHLKATDCYQWLNAVPSTVLTQSLRDQDQAFMNFFQGRARHPRFKKRRHNQSIRFQLDQRQIHRTFNAHNSLLKLPGLGQLKLRWSPIPTGIPKMVTVRRDAAGRYFVTFMCEETVQTKPVQGKAVGLDAGIKSVLVTSDGTVHDGLRAYHQTLKRLKRAQRSLSRKVKGSHRWHQQRLKVARLHAKVADARTDYLQKLSTKLVNENHVISIEDLNVAGMVKNRQLARHLSDAAIAELYRMLAYKCQWYGRTLLTVDRWYPSSKTCSDCGYVHAELQPSDRQWSCGGCGSHHDRDHNAAINILHEGLKQLVPGGTGELTRVESDTTLPRSAVGAGPQADDEAQARQPVNTCQEQE